MAGTASLLAAVVALRSRDGGALVRLLPGEPDWNLGKPLRTVIVTESWGHARDRETGLDMHGALDLRTKPDTTQAVFAVHDGVIVQAGPAGTAGNMVTLDHRDGMASRYLHLSQVEVTKGQVVRRGQEIARAGETASVGKPHLHFDLWVDPAQVPLYVRRFGSPTGLGQLVLTVSGKTKAKIPAEPLIAADGYQADVVADAARVGVLLRPGVAVVA